MYLAQSRIDATIDDNTALKSFKAWLGKFADEKSGNKVNTTKETIVVPVVAAKGEVSADVIAEVGTLDKARYHRDVEDHKRDYDRWVNNGRKDSMPIGPNKDHYYQRKDVQIPVSAIYTSVFGIAADQFGLPSGIAKDVSKAAVKLVEGDLHGKIERRNEVADAPSYDEELIKANLSKVATGALRPKIREALRKYDKTYSEEVSDIGSPWQAVIYEVPFIVVRYEHGGNKYVYAIDAVTGKTQLGTKPATLMGHILTFALILGLLAGSGYAYETYIRPLFH